jgi:hypothetical protein
MKKTKIFLSIAFVSLGIFFISFNISLAGCCVSYTGGVGNNCTTTDDKTGCEKGGGNYLNGECSHVATNCKTAGSNTTTTNPAAASASNTSTSNPSVNNQNNNKAAPAATNTASSGGIVSFTNPLSFNTVEGLLGTILTAVQRVVVSLALVFIVIGAVMILTSAGSPDMMEKGKKAITMALAGLAIGIAAPSILKELAGVLGWGSTPDATVNMAMSLSEIAVRVLSFLLGIAGTLALIMLVVGAIMYLTSAGDEERIDTGKKIFKYSLIGIIIVLSSLILVKQIALFFSVG